MLCTFVWNNNNNKELWTKVRRGKKDEEREKKKLRGKRGNTTRGKRRAYKKRYGSFGGSSLSVSQFNDKISKNSIYMLLLPRPRWMVRCILCKLSKHMIPYLSPFFISEWYYLIYNIIIILIFNIVIIFESYILINDFCTLNWKCPWFSFQKSGHRKPEWYQTIHQTTH